MNKRQTIDVEMAVDTEQLDDAVNEINKAADALERTIPNVTIRNNETVYVTINNWNHADDTKPCKDGDFE